MALISLPYRHINASYLETVSNILCRDENWWLCGSQGKIQMFPGYLRPVVTLIQVMTVCDCLLSGEDAS